MVESISHLSDSYPHIEQIAFEKVIQIEKQDDYFLIITNKKSYTAKIIVLAIGYSNTFDIKGMMQYVVTHKKAVPEKQRIQLENVDHKVTENIYVVGTLAGWRSQLTIAAGSGAAVATDILTLWNNGIETQAHDSINK